MIDRIVSNHPAFTLHNLPETFPLELQKDQSYVFTIQYDPIDTFYTTGWLSFEIEGKWNSTLFLEAGDTLIRHPLRLNPPIIIVDEEVGNTMEITWSGCFPNDPVHIRFSPDNGRTWKDVTDTATGFRYVWAFPSMFCDSCLLEIEHGNRVNVAYIPTLTSGVKQNFDRWGNAYIAGTYDRKVQFSDTTIEPVGRSDSYILSLRNDGSTRWMKTISGPQSNAIFAFRAGDHHSYYLVDGDEKPGIIQDSVIVHYPALLKLDNLTGRLLWIAPDSTLPESAYYSMFLDAKENTFIAGRGQEPSILVRKIDSSGATLWTTQIDATSTLVYGQFVDAAPDDWVVVGGLFNKTIETQGSATEAQGREDGVIALLDNKGKTIWVKTLGSSSPDPATSVGFGPDSSIVFIQRFSGDTLFVGNDATLSLRRKFGAVVGAYSREGRLLWTDQIDCDGDCRFGSPIWLPEENVIMISGSVNDTIWFANEPLMTDRVFNNFGSFYATYTPTGNLLCADKRPRYSMPNDYTLFGSMFSWGDSLNRAYVPVNCLLGYAPEEDRRQRFTIYNPAGIATGQTGNPTAGLCLTPNPASTYIVIELKEGAASNLLLEVVDMLGSVRLQTDLTAEHLSGTIRLDISALPPGTYGVLVKNSRGIIGWEPLQIKR